MKVFQISVIFILLTAFSFTSGAQQLKENEIVVIHGVKYVLHQVRTGETIFSISRDFKIDRSKLIEENPDIDQGLVIGQILKIPFSEEVDPLNIPVSQKGDPTRYISHVIESRNETPYFIAKKYGITVEEIYAYNPEIRRFRKGTEIRIPVWEQESQKEATVQKIDDVPPVENSTSELTEHVVVAGETLYSIAKKYQVAESEILFLNPEAKNLKTGSKIYLPVKQSEVIVKDNGPDKTFNGNYFEHVIESGETLWGVAHIFNVSGEELISLNPFLKDGFPAGAVIKIPLEKSQTTKVTAINEDAFTEHFVQKGETLFGLAQKYNVSIPEIKEYNPLLANRNPVEGEMILIPKKKVEPQPLNTETIAETQESATEIPKSFYKVDVAVEVPETCMPKTPGIFDSPTYNVALFLPLFLEANDTLNRQVMMPDTLNVLSDEMLADTLIEQEEPKELFKQFYGNSENFLQFYEGVLVAVDSMQKAGMNIYLHVFDTQNNVDSVRKIIYSGDIQNVDLIIGPVYQNLQEEVGRFAQNNHIPMISPFASRSDIISNNSSFFQLNPSREYILKKTAEMVADEYYNSNFIVVKTSDFERTPEGGLVNLIREKLYNSGYMNRGEGARFTVYDFKNEGTFGLSRIMTPEKENVVLIPTSDEGELSVAISNINNLTNDYSITLIGTNNYQQRYPSIDIAQFHNLKLKYIYPFWTDYNDPATIQFIKKFRSNFRTEPNSFSIQGFDAAYFFLNALYYYGKDFQGCLPYIHANLVQGNYHFEKISESGGYMNKGVSVISYARDYEVKRERVIGQPRLVLTN